MPEIREEAMSPEERASVGAIQQSVSRSVEPVSLRARPPEASAPPDFPGPRPMSGAGALMGGAPMVEAPAAEQRQASGIGNAFKSLMGYSTSYEVDPETGQTEAVVAKRKPGEFFRALLAGALLGGAAGAGEESIATGMVKGGAAVSADTERRDEAKFQRAQEEFKTQQAAAAAKREEERLKLEQQRTKTEETIAAATIANMTATQLYNDNHLKLLSRDQAVRLQQLESDIQQRLIDNAAKGIRPIDVPMNGRPGNGEEFKDFYMKNEGKGLFKPGPGKFLQLVANYDYSGLSYDEATKVWRDDEGNKIDPADRATYTVYEVPVAATHDQISMPGSILQDKYDISVPDRNANYPMTLSQLMSASLVKMQTIAKDTQDSLAQRRLDWTMAYQTLQAKRDALENRRQSIDRDDSILDPNVKRAYQAPIDKEIDKVVDEMDKVFYQMTHDGDERPKEPGPDLSKLPKAQAPGEIATPEIMRQYAAAFDSESEAIDALNKAGFKLPGEEEQPKPESKSMKQKVKEYVTDPERLVEAGLTLVNPALPATRQAAKQVEKFFKED